MTLSENTIEFEKCACGNTSSKIFRDFGNNKVIECTSCGLFRSFPLPQKSICDDVYQEVNSAQKLHPHQIFVLNKVAKLSENCSVKILDVGCSTGNMMEYLKRKGFINTCGIEVNKYAVQMCLSKRLDVKKMDVSEIQLNEIYDVIYLNHVLEHILDLNDFLCKIKKLLKSGSYVLIAVPNIGGTKDTENWIGYQFEQHYWHFTPKSLERIFINNGFTSYKSYTLSGGRLKSLFNNIFKIQGDSLVSIFKYE